MDQKKEFVDGMSWIERVAKRGFDCLGALFLLLLFSPLILMIYIALWWQRDGAPIFKQERIGNKGKPFYIYKFRSMRMDAETGTPNL